MLHYICVLVVSAQFLGFMALVGLADGATGTASSPLDPPVVHRPTQPNAGNTQSVNVPTLPPTDGNGRIRVQRPHQQGTASPLPRSSAPPPVRAPSRVSSATHPYSPPRPPVQGATSHAPARTVAPSPRPAAAQTAAKSAPGAAAGAEDAYAPTSSKAPPSPVYPERAPANPSATAAATTPGGGPPTPTAAGTPTDPSVHKTVEQPDQKTKIPHKGFVAEARAGALGCFGSVCGDGHRMDPGVQVGGFLGGNIRGFVELGVQGGWGKLRPNIPEGRDVLSLYGIDGRALEDEIQAQMDLPTEVDLNLAALNVQSAQSSAAHGGLALRFHIVPRGRVAAYLGSGVNYQLFRSQYDTPLGPTKMDFHGLSVPVQVGLGVYLHRRIAITGEFDYLWTKFLVAKLDHPMQQLVAPISALESASDAVDADFGKSLPAFWTATVALRITL